MKKIITLIAIFCLSFASIAQEKSETFPQDIDKKHELKFNALTLVAGPWLDFSYEYLIDEESSFGVAATYNTNRSENDLNYMLAPYYRRYFSGKFARGFFVEGFGALYSAREFTLFSPSTPFETGFALGVSVGGKWVSKKGFTAELVLGVGRNLIDNDALDGIGRIGISMGYRF
ncbi:MAG: DUF3575 domain-containing protein [Flavobacteriaceae bacterium]|nr:DUF3575 domain-containing protein [Flavobacteriaceae bacterium]|tara:strand:+ start:99330 stop:99851 length:522 start_codon:yes stop_codon:yes gene_type:complete